jgi:hypothetical protein
MKEKHFWKMKIQYFLKGSNVGFLGFAARVYIMSLKNQQIGIYSL